MDEGASGHEWTGEVDPWAVVVRRGLWYLLCANATAEVRTYRVDRVTSVEVLSTPADVPADLDAVVELPFVVEGGDELVAAMHRLVARLHAALPAQG